jgi:hypothetical protein
MLLLLPSRVYNKLTPKAGPGPDREEIYSVKEHLEELLAQSLLHLQRDGVLPADTELEIQLERTRSPEHGEFASNLAMVLAKPAGMPPRELAIHQFLFTALRPYRCHQGRAASKREIRRDLQARA